MAETAVDDEVTLGIRPEDIVLCGAEEPGALSGVVDLVEDIGAEDFLSVTVSGVTCVVRTSTHHPPMEGERVGMRFPVDVLHIFDAPGGTIRAVPAMSKPGLEACGSQ